MLFPTNLNRTSQGPSTECSDPKVGLFPRLAGIESDAVAPASVAKPTGQELNPTLQKVQTIKGFREFGKATLDSVVYNLLVVMENGNGHCLWTGTRAMAKFLRTGKVQVNNAIRSLVADGFIAFDPDESKHSENRKIKILHVIAIHSHRAKVELISDWAELVSEMVVEPAPLLHGEVGEIKAAPDASGDALVIPAAKSKPKRATKKRAVMTDELKLRITSNSRLMNRYLCYGSDALDLDITALETLAHGPSYFRDHQTPGAVETWTAAQFVGYFWSLVSDIRSRQVPPVQIDMPPFGELCMKITRMLDAQLGWGMTKRQVYEHINSLVKYFEVIRVMVSPLQISLGPSSLDHKLCREKLSTFAHLPEEQVQSLFNQLIATRQAQSARRADDMIESEEVR